MGREEKHFCVDLAEIVRIYVTRVSAQMVKHLPAMQETRVQSLSGEDPLEEGMATHSRIVAWRIPRSQESGGLQSMG